MLAAIAKPLRYGAPRLVTIMIATCLIAAPFLLVRPRPASANPVCGLLPTSTVQGICNTVSGVVAPGTGNVPGVPNPIKAIGGLAGDAAQAVVQPMLNSITQAEASSVGSLMNSDINFINKVSTPALNENWFIQQYKELFGYAVIIAVGLMLLRMVYGASLGNLFGIGNAFGAFIAFIIGGFFIPPLTRVIVYAMDSTVTPALLHASGVDITSVVSGLEKSLTSNLGVTGSTTAIAAPAIMLLFAVIGGIITLFELIFREAMLYVMILVEVLALALMVGGQWTAGVFWKCTKVLIGVILLKPAIALLLDVAISLGSPGASSNDVNIMGVASLVMCLLIPFVSWTAYKSFTGHNVPVQGALGRTAQAVKAMKAAGG